MDRGVLLVSPNAPRNGAAVPRDRFMAKVDTTGDCWTWTAALRGDGYPSFWLDGRNQGAHRISYEIFVGPIPDGMAIDHRCSNRSCVKPDHLEVVTTSENLSRRDLPTGANTWQGAKTHCPHGHEYTDENTIRSGKSRVCRACRRAYKRRYRARLKAGA